MQIECTGERDAAAGWSFDLQVLDDDGELFRFEMTLSWADYNLWSASGSDRPAAVAEAAMRFLLAGRPPRELRPRFDAAIARRVDRDADARIPGLIGD
jgi:hypothetical protein